MVHLPTNSSYNHGYTLIPVHNPIYNHQTGSIHPLDAPRRAWRSCDGPGASLRPWGGQRWCRVMCPPQVIQVTQVISSGNFLVRDDSSVKVAFRRPPPFLKISDSVTSELSSYLTNGWPDDSLAFGSCRFHPPAIIRSFCL